MICCVLSPLVVWLCVKTMCNTMTCDESDDMCGEARSSQIQIQSEIRTWNGADRLMKAGVYLIVRVRVGMVI